MTASRYVMTIIAMALICVNFVASAGALLLPPDVYTSAWTLVAGLGLAVPLAIVYYYRGGEVRALWRYLLVVLVGSVLLGFVFLPGAAFLGIASILQGLSGLLIIIGLYLVAMLLVFGDAWSSVRQGVLSAAGRDERGRGGP